MTGKPTEKRVAQLLDRAIWLMLRREHVKCLQILQYLRRTHGDHMDRRLDYSAGWMERRRT